MLLVSPRSLPGSARPEGQALPPIREARLGPRTRPSLFERFCAADAAAPTSARAEREALRALVLRDLSALFNSTNHEHLLDPTRFGAVLESCWNFGLRSISGSFDGPKAWDEIEQSLRAAIDRFEPRIQRGSVELTVQHDAGVARHNMLSFQIRGLIRDLPQALPFVVRSALDLETRRVWFDAREGAPGPEPVAERG